VIKFAPFSFRIWSPTPVIRRAGTFRLIAAVPLLLSCGGRARKSYISRSGASTRQRAWLRRAPIARKQPSARNRRTRCPAVVPPHRLPTFPPAPSPDRCWSSGAGWGRAGFGTAASRYAARLLRAISVPNYEGSGRSARCRQARWLPGRWEGDISVFVK